MRRIFLLFVASVLAGCAGNTRREPVGVNPPKINLPRAAEPQKDPRVMPSQLLGRAAGGVHGPYLAHNGSRALALAVVPSPQGVLSLQARPLDGNAEAGEPRDLGPAPADVALFSLVPGPGGGYLALLTRKIEGGHVFEARSLDESGAPRGKATTLFQGAEAPAWIDAVATPTGFHAYFTLMTPAGGRLLAVDADERGEPRGAPSLLFDGAASWQAVSSGKGSMLLVVASQGPQTGHLQAIPVGDGARPGATQILPREQPVSPEIEAVSINDRVYVGWDERGPLDMRVKLAALGPDGKPAIAPRTVLKSAGDQGLIALARGGQDQLLATWDDLAMRRDEGRWIRLTTLPLDLAAPAAEGALFHAMTDGSYPLLQPAPWGFGALSLTRSCKEGEPCDQAPVLPTFVRLGPDLAPLSQAPVLIDGGLPPDSAWSMFCGSQGCGSLALDHSFSSFSLRLDAEPSPAPAAGFRLSSNGITSTAASSLWRGPRVAEVVSAQLADSWLAVSVTDHPEGSPMPPLPPDVDKRAEADKDRSHQRNPRGIAARSAIITTHALAKSGAVDSKTVTVRALSSPGIAVAPDAQGKDACIAWVARDNGDPEVFLTRVDRDGKRLTQQPLTHARGDVLDVALTPVDDGWIVVWVDTRHGNGEVYAARVDASLRRKGPEQRITTAPGDAADLAVATRGKQVIVAFSDSRSAPDSGVGDVFLARLKADDASRIGEEARVASTPDHGRGLQLEPMGDDLLLAWIEQPPPSKTEARPAQIQLATLDKDGALRSLPEALSLGRPGPLSSMTMKCQADACRFVVGRPDGHQLWLSAFSYSRGRREASLSDLLPLFAGSAADVTPTLGPNWILVGDDAANNEGRLRRVAVRWP